MPPSIRPSRIAIANNGPSGSTPAALLAGKRMDVTLFNAAKRPEMIVGESGIATLVPLPGRRRASRPPPHRDIAARIIAGNDIPAEAPSASVPLIWHTARAAKMPNPMDNRHPARDRR